MSIKMRDSYGACVSADLLNDTLVSYVDKIDLEEKLNDILAEFASMRCLSNDGGLGYKDLLLAKEFFRMGFAAAHVVNHIEDNE